MPVAIKSTGGGSVTLTAPNTASDLTLTLPSATGTVLSTGSTVTVAQGGTGATTLTANNVILGNGTSAVQFVAPGTSGNVLTSNGTTWTSATPAGITQGTLVSASGTAVDFTGISSTAKRITVQLNGLSTNGTSVYIVQIGSGSFSTSGYTGGYGSIASNGGAGAGATSQGFGMAGPWSGGASNQFTGLCTITAATGFTYTAAGSWGVSGGSYTGGGGSGGTITLGGVLDRIRVTTANGTDTFDAGTINILVE